MRSRSRWDDNIMIDFKEIKYGGVHYIFIYQDSSSGVLVNAVLNLRIE